LSLILIIGEYYARLKHGNLLQEKASTLQYRNADLKLNHSFIPSASGSLVTEGEAIPYNINSLGFRDREYSLKKPEGTFRIVTVGDSYTEGYGVRIEETFIKVLEGMLNNSSGNTKYEVINYGMASYSPLLEYLLLKEKAMELDPDMVILLYDYSDLKDDHEYEMTAFFDEDGRPLKCMPHERVRAYSSNPVERFLIKHLRFYLYTENRINKGLFKVWSKTNKRKVENLRGDPFLAFRSEEEAKVREYWQSNKKYLGFIRNMLNERGIDFVIVSYPYPIEVNKDGCFTKRTVAGFKMGRLYEQPQIVSLLKQFALENDTPFINTYDYFMSNNTQPLYLKRDRHFNKRGNRVMAEALFEALKPLGIPSESE